MSTSGSGSTPRPKVVLADDLMACLEAAQREGCFSKDWAYAARRQLAWAVYLDNSRGEAMYAEIADLLAAAGDHFLLGLSEVEDGPQRDRLRQLMNLVMDRWKVVAEASAARKKTAGVAGGGSSTGEAETATAADADAGGGGGDGDGGGEPSATPSRETTASTTSTPTSNAAPATAVKLRERRGRSRVLHGAAIPGGAGIARRTWDRRAIRFGPGGVSAADALRAAAMGEDLPRSAATPRTTDARTENTTPAAEAVTEESKKKDVDARGEGDEAQPRADALQAILRRKARGQRVSWRVTKHFDGFFDLGAGEAESGEASGHREPVKIGRKTLAPIDAPPVMETKPETKGDAADPAASHLLGLFPAGSPHGESNTTASRGRSGSGGVLVDPSGGFRPGMMRADPDYMVLFECVLHCIEQPLLQRGASEMGKERARAYLCAVYETDPGMPSTSEIISRVAAFHSSGDGDRDGSGRENPARPLPIGMLLDDHRRWFVNLARAILHHESRPAPTKTDPRRREFSPLSTDARRILDEYAHRFGVSEFFRHLVVLRILEHYFDHQPPLVMMIATALTQLVHLDDDDDNNNNNNNNNGGGGGGGGGGVTACTPAESALYDDTLTRLLGHVRYRLVHFRDIFVGNRPEGALGSLVELLGVLSRTRLDLEAVEGESFPGLLWRYVRAAGQDTFDRLARSRSEVPVVPGDPSAAGWAAAFTSRELLNMCEIVLGDVEADRNHFAVDFPVTGLPDADNIIGESGDTSDDGAKGRACPLDLVTVSTRHYHTLLGAAVRTFARTLTRRSSCGADADALAAARVLRRVHKALAPTVPEERETPLYTLFAPMLREWVGEIEIRMASWVDEAVRSDAWVRDATDPASLHSSSVVDVYQAITEALETFKGNAYVGEHGHEHDADDGTKLSSSSTSSSTVDWRYVTTLKSFVAAVCRTVNRYADKVHARAEQRIPLAIEDGPTWLREAITAAEKGAVDVSQQQVGKKKSASSSSSSGVGGSGGDIGDGSDSGSCASGDTTPRHRRVMTTLRRKLSRAGHGPKDQSQPNGDTGGGGGGGAGKKKLHAAASPPPSSPGPAQGPGSPSISGGSKPSRQRSSSVLLIREEASSSPRRMRRESHDLVTAVARGQLARRHSFDQTAPSDGGVSTASAMGPVVPEDACVCLNDVEASRRFLDSLVTNAEQSLPAADGSSDGNGRYFQTAFAGAFRHTRVVGVSLAHLVAAWMNPRMVQGVAHLVSDGNGVAGNGAGQPRGGEGKKRRGGSRLGGFIASKFGGGGGSGGDGGDDAEDDVDDTPPPDDEIADRLAPLLEYLDAELANLHDWLYPSALKNVLRATWDLLLADLEAVLLGAGRVKPLLPRQALIVRHSLDHLVSFFHAEGSGLPTGYLDIGTATLHRFLDLYGASSDLLVELAGNLVSAEISARGKGEDVEEEGIVDAAERLRSTDVLRVLATRKDKDAKNAVKRWGNGLP